MNIAVQLRPLFELAGEYQHLKIQYDDRRKAVWIWMCARPRPCFILQQLEEFLHLCESLRNVMDDPQSPEIAYIVVASSARGVFSLGGDMESFVACVRRQDRDKLKEYAHKCVHVLHENITNIGRDVTTIALVQGDALGGGFESAMASDVLIAERSAKLGLPEILFNLFPGMGAYSLLSRKVGSKKAEEIILGGCLYTAQDLYDMGIVDVLVDDGEGLVAVEEYIQKEDRARNGVRAFRSAQRCCHPISLDELLGVADIWVDAALRLREKDLRMMERLVKRQTIRSQQG